MHLAFSKIAWYFISKIWSEYIEVTSFFEAFAQANTMAQSDFDFTARL
jgi:hypothetical protein